MKKIFAAVLAFFSSNASACGLYSLVSPASTERLGRWQEAFPTFDQVVGYSALGHFFVRASKSREYAVIHPFKVAAKSYGVFPDDAAFEAAVLQEPGFQSYVLREAHVGEICRRLGPLKENQIYIPEPYPFLGGSEEPETYSKGDVWVFANILGQMVRLHGDD